MKVRIERLPPTQVLGISLDMSLAANRTQQLWQSFMPQRHQIKHRTSTDSISMQIYNDTDKSLFAPDTRFTKWACVEVANTKHQPITLQPYNIAGGLYAVFDHHGPATAFAKSFSYIFEQWLPNSNYQLDSREHFEKLPERYHPLDENAFEEIWIPIRSE